MYTFQDADRRKQMLDNFGCVFFSFLFLLMGPYKMVRWLLWWNIAGKYEEMVLEQLNCYLLCLERVYFPGLLSIAISAVVLLTINSSNSLLFSFLFLRVLNKINLAYLKMSETVRNVTAMTYLLNHFDDDQQITSQN